MTIRNDGKEKTMSADEEKSGGCGCGGCGCGGGKNKVREGEPVDDEGRINLGLKAAAE